MKLLKLLLGRPNTEKLPLKERVLRAAAKVLAVGHRQNPSGNNMSQR